MEFMYGAKINDLLKYLKTKQKRSNLYFTLNKVIEIGTSKSEKWSRQIIIYANWHALH